MTAHLFCLAADKPLAGAMVVSRWASWTSSVFSSSHCSPVTVGYRFVPNGTDGRRYFGPGCSTAETFCFTEGRSLFGDLRTTEMRVCVMKTA
jgi:hypothetical protein